MKSSQSLVVMSVASLLLALCGCEREGPAEKVGENIDETAEKIQEGVEATGDKAIDKLEQAGDKLEEATDSSTR